MNDPYLYEGTTVLRNLLNIQDEKALGLAEAEISSANMMLLYEKGFSDFTTKGLKGIHKALFGDIYSWAGEFRTINIRKREELLVGKSVWYANLDDIERDLKIGWTEIRKINWPDLSREDFVKRLSRTFPKLWQAHPFRDGNTRTIVMLMMFFVECYGYYFDLELFAASAGYVRNAFVLCCFDSHSEYEHLEKILLDTISDTPLLEDNLDEGASLERIVKYEQYYTENYQPTAHEIRDDSD
jgi:cell filamentation protein